LIQTRRIKSFPVILMGSEYWKGLLDWLKKTMVRGGMILPEDLDFIEIIDDPDEAVRHIQKFVIV
jgi:predicted Rossmann-fold nucleotide-binding protein